MIEETWDNSGAPLLLDAAPAPLTTSRALEARSMANSECNKSVEWRPVVGREGLYEVSDDGQVRAVSDSRILRTSVSRGYLTVSLKDAAGGKPRNHRVHRLVARAFVPNPNDKPNINHIDCNTTNNAAENLEWCTQAENLEHSRRLGRMPQCFRGVRNNRSKLSDENVRAVRALYAAGGRTLLSIASEFGVSERAIGAVVRRQSYRFVAEDN